MAMLAPGWSLHVSRTAPLGTAVTAASAAVPSINDSRDNGVGVRTRTHVLSRDQLPKHGHGLRARRIEGEQVAVAHEACAARTVAPDRRAAGVRVDVVGQ